MTTQTSILHVRIDDHLRAEATEKPATLGLTVSDAVRILLTRVARDGGLPPGLTMDPVTYDACFRAKVHEAMADASPLVAHRQVMDDAQALKDEIETRAAELAKKPEVYIWLIYSKDAGIDHVSKLHCCL